MLLWPTSTGKAERLSSVDFKKMKTKSICNMKNAIKSAVSIWLINEKNMSYERS